MSAGAAVVSLLREVGAAPGGQGLADPRSWLVAVGGLVLLGGVGWWMRRPVRRRASTHAPDESTARPAETETPGLSPEAPRQLAPDDDEEFLRELGTRYPRPEGP